MKKFLKPTVKNIILTFGVVLCISLLCIALDNLFNIDIEAGYTLFFDIYLKNYDPQHIGEYEKYFNYFLIPFWLMAYGISCILFHYYSKLRKIDSNNETG